MTKYSIIIRAYNEEKHIGRLLTGVTQQTSQDYEIILVDSGSTDATAAIASRFPVKVVQIQPEDFTFGFSLNQGIAASTGEIIVIASAHVYPVYPDWLERLTGPFSNPKVAVTYGKQRGNRHSKFSEHQIFKQWFPDDEQTHQSYPFCNNANAAIRKSLWEMKKYDENLSGLEDLEWALWAFSDGYKVQYVPEAEIIHIHDETPKGVYNRYRREAMAFKRIFPDENFGFLSFLRMLLTNSISDTWYAIREKAFKANWRGILWFRYMQFWGTYQGYRETGPLTAKLRQTFYYPRSLRLSSATMERNVSPIDYGELDS